MMHSITEDATRITRQMPAVVVRPHQFTERVVLAGGHPGCGKSLVTAVLGSFARVEIQKYNYPLEHICSLYFLGKLDDDTAITMIQMLTDMDLYNMMMSRETNFRPSDCSSIFQNPGPWRYVRRLFESGNAAAVERVKRTKPILHILINNLLASSPPLFKALGERMRLVEIVRHPLYMVKQWHLYIDRYGTDVRDFGILVEAGGKAVPWFARGWEDRYLQAPPMDRVIYAIAHLFELGEQVFERLSGEEKAQVVRIPFEPFVLDPWPYVRQLETLLGTTATRLTRRELKRQNVPRRMIAEARPLPIYKQYGWEPPQKGASERRELERRRHYAAEHATAQAMEELDRMSQVYEDTYLRGLL